ncbi:MAG TPA: hypothetical protein VEQ63_07990 [Bryobacteraceae bacterium]|nr:hypothetical protein [Bryobacteraceae bacterium]
MKLAALLLAILATAVPGRTLAQDFVQRGTLEYKGYFFPQLVPNDSAHAVGEALFRYEIEKVLIPNLRLSGATETRLDTHHQVKRKFYVNWSDRELQRPAFSIRRLSFIYNKSGWTVEVGKQAVRWGKADILNPTDRFAPRDFLSVVDTDFLPVTAARAIYEGKSDSFEIVVQPRFTPSRTPLLNQRWTVLPPELEGVPINDLGHRIPGGAQTGARWNHLGRGYEMSLSFYDGHNHLPLLEGQPAILGFDVQRWYPAIRTYGADAAVPLTWFTLKGEGAYFTTTDARADEYLLYVIQLERQVGELSLIGGYSGEWVTDRRSPFQFAPDRGISRSFLGRATYTISSKRSAAVEYAIRQNLDGAWLRSEFSQMLGNNWRAIAGFTLIRGEPTDFLGQYRRNSHFSLILRCNF